MTNTDKPNLSGKQDIADDLKSKAESASRHLKDEGSEQLEEYSAQAAGSMDSVADAAQAAADSLGDSNQTMLSSYVAELATGISDLADNLRHKNTDEILQDVSRLARDNAGLFLLGSVAIGFGLARIAKAGEEGSRSRAYRSSDDYPGWEGYYGVGGSAEDESEELSAHARQSSFSESDTDALRGAGKKEPQTHAGTSYLPDEGSSSPASQQATGSPPIGESPTKPGARPGA